MVPIFEQGEGHGIGHSIDSFTQRFIEICQSHLETKRAESFAFIFYDFDDRLVSEILRDQGGFAKLDRLSGNNMSIFFLHSDDRYFIERYNELFLHTFEIDPDRKLPFVLFFKLEEDDVTELEVVELEHHQLMHAFQELYTIIENKIDQTQRNTKPIPTNKWIKWINYSKKIAVQELIKQIVKSSID